jgi:ferredoxin
MQVKIEADLCTACELCTDEVPEVFRMGDDVAEVIEPEVPANLEAKVKSSAEDCPGSAIIIE